MAASTATSRPTIPSDADPAHAAHRRSPGAASPRCSLAAAVAPAGAWQPCRRPRPRSCAGSRPTSTASGPWRRTFRQLAPDGGESTGKLYHRPRPRRHALRLRPAVQDPAGRTGDWRLIFYDGSIKQVNVIPITKTPLGFLLNDDVKLAGDVTVESVAGARGRRSTSPCAAPTPRTRARSCSPWPPTRCSSARWAVTDAQGLTTTIALDRPADRHAARPRALPSGATPRCSASPRTEHEAACPAGRDGSSRPRIAQASARR